MKTIAHKIRSFIKVNGMAPGEAASSRSGSGDDEVNPGRWLILFAVLTGNLIAPFASSTINIALPTISEEFGLDVSSASWIPMVYLLVMTSLVLVFGRLGDLKGYKGIYLGGLGVFMTASVLCAVSRGFFTLISARALQAVGSGMFSAMVPAIVARIFPPNERGRALGLLGMTVAVGLSLGPPISGFLVSSLGWRSIFYINVPVALAAFFWGRSVIPAGHFPSPSVTSVSSSALDEPCAPKTSDGSGGGASSCDSLRRRRAGAAFDIKGAISIAVGLTLFVLLVNRGTSWGYTSARSLLTLLATFVCFGLFLRIEPHTPEPLLDLGIFKNASFTLANLAAIASFMGQYTMVFLTPFYLERIIGLTPSASGRMMMYFPLITLFIAPLSGIITDRYGVRLPAVMGATIASVALILMANSAVRPDIVRAGSTTVKTEAVLAVAGETSASINTNTAAVVTATRMTILGLALFGLGTGLFQSPNNTAVMSSVPKARLGIAGGVLTTTRNLGMVLGIAFGASVFTARYQVHLSQLLLGQPKQFSDGLIATSAYLAALRDSYLVAAIMAGLAVPFSMFIKTTREGR